jgi:hypothetical protein
MVCFAVMAGGAFDRETYGYCGGAIGLGFIRAPGTGSCAGLSAKRIFLTIRNAPMTIALSAILNVGK